MKVSTYYKDQFKEGNNPHKEYIESLREIDESLVLVTEDQITRIYSVPKYLVDKFKIAFENHFKTTNTNFLITIN